MRGATPASLLLALTVAACGGSEEPEDTGETTAGAEPSVSLILELEGTPLCGAATDRLEFATRRVGCWDPAIPCTSPAVPPWLPGTTRACADLEAGTLRWEVTVDGAGQYETQLRALAGDDSQEGVHCYAAGAEDLTRITNADLEGNADLFVSEIADNQCTNP